MSEERPMEVVEEDKEEERKRKRVSEAFLGSGLLLSNLAIDVILERNIRPSRIIKAAREKNVFMVTKEFIEEFFPKEEKEEYSFVVKKGKPAAASQVEGKLRLYENRDITGKSTSEGTVENFMELFRDRYKRIRSVLEERPMLKDVVDIANVQKYEGGQVKIIGMVTALRESKKGNTLIEVEDTTGKALVVHSGDLRETGTLLVTDQLIGVVGTVRGDLILAKEIIEPDIPATKKQPECDEPVSIAFLSDIHVGSLLFKEAEFQRFLGWLNLQGDGNQRQIAQQVKYLFIAGDLVDGIGIYPSQESELSIPDIYKQYDYLARLLEQIPSYIEVIVSVGNHDAVRRCEPQPSVNGYLDSLKELPNVHLVGNPAWVNAHGFDVLMYHGTSMDALISSLSQLSYSQPERAQIEYLKKRHLSPIYGTKEQIAPEERDYMVIDSVPDIFHCGHVHKNGYANYRGVRVINSGTWQAQTDYQQQQGHMPTPCKVPILDLQNLQLKVINFEAG
ncbi:MAG: DNA-directed DNA polymerase II small subunit [Candidatus Altiarchaeota archaeon]|nr:DNA-directed DNA polymerase II small subunit [Candidatus Altiarchaeota archaeon]